MPSLRIPTLGRAAAIPTRVPPFARRAQYVFHVLPESSTKGGAIWAAQRVPRDHVIVVANAFVIGEIDPSDGANFAFSPNMHAVAKANGWWDGVGKLHFTRTFSAGEYSSRYCAPPAHCPLPASCRPTSHLLTSSPPHLPIT